MVGGNGRWAIALMACMMATGLASAQDAADYTVDGITYYAAAGSHTSGHLTMGLDHSGEAQADFEGCVHMRLRDKPAINDAGRLQVFGKLGGQFVEFDFNSFAATIPEMDGGLAQDIWVDGSHLHVGEIQHPAVLAGMAGWGSGSLIVNTVPYYDPVTGLGEYQASMFVTPNGFRDNETGAILNVDGGIWQPGEQARIGQDDWEVHLRVESLPGARQADETFTAERPEGDAGYFMPSEGYAEQFIFDNLRFGGTATIRLESEALAQAGDNTLSFRFRDPHGELLDEVTLEPTLMAAATHEVTVPMDKFGKYTMAVTGTVSLSQYTFTLIQHTPALFDMNFWWDNTTFAGHSTRALWDCEDEIGQPEMLVANVVDRVPPPRFAWGPIGFGLAGLVAGIITAGLLIYHSGSHKR